MKQLIKKLNKTFYLIFLVLRTFTKVLKSSQKFFESFTNFYKSSQKFFESFTNFYKSSQKFSI